MGRWALLLFCQAEDGIRDATVTGVQTCALPISTIDHAAWPGDRISAASGGNRYRSAARRRFTTAVKAGTTGTRRTRKPRTAARCRRRRTMRAAFTNAYSRRNRIPAAIASSSIERGTRNSRPRSPPAACAARGVRDRSFTTPSGAGRDPARPTAKLARAADVRFEARAEVIAITATTLRRTTGHPEAPAIDIAANRAPSSGSWRDRGPCARQFHAGTGFDGRTWHVSGPLVSTGTV